LIPQPVIKFEGASSNWPVKKFLFVSFYQGSRQNFGEIRGQKIKIGYAGILPVNLNGLIIYDFYSGNFTGLALPELFPAFNSLSEQVKIGIVFQPEKPFQRKFDISSCHWLAIMKIRLAAEIENGLSSSVIDYPVLRQPGGYLQIAVKF